MSSQRIQPLKNVIQNYAWGSTSAISELLDIPNPNSEPQAEIWMGAHPKAPSHLVDEGCTLDVWIGKDPQSVLGTHVAERFDAQLPYLFKVLSAGKPLSIQAHPSLEQARAGYAAEEAVAIAPDDFTRNYKDPNRKPEIICALTRFTAMNGFRKLGEILTNFMDLDIVAPEFAAFQAQPDRQGLKAFYSALMSLRPARATQLVDDVLLRARAAKGMLMADTVLSLQQHFPGDIGVISPLLLNVIILAPGEAMYLPAGELHAYLCGTGMELMANSDNVLRGALTPKHVDIPELLRILSYRAGSVPVLTPEPRASGEAVYVTTASEFQLSVINAILPVTCRPDSAEILITVEGRATLMNGVTGETLSLNKGCSCLVPAAVTHYTITGPAKVFKASVPADAGCTAMRLD